MAALDDYDDEDSRESWGDGDFADDIPTGEDPWRCQFGADCLVADPHHRSDECFTAEWAEAYYADLDDEEGE